MTMLGAYLEPRTAVVWSGGLVTALTYFGNTSTGSRVALSRFVQRGLAERVKRGRLVFYRLTDRCLHLLEDGDQRIFSLGQPVAEATSWTIVWHALPDSHKAERTQLVRQLRFHGFGQLQDNTWLSPCDYAVEVRELVSLLGVTDRVTIFRAQPDDHVETGPLIKHLWQLDVVAARYRAFAAHYRPLTRRSAISDKDAFVSCTEMMHAFRAFSSIDPELDESWIPHAGVRLQAIDIFQRVLHRLKPPAAAYFQELTRAEP
jgi:phenylacetic acid degradation operon negative regulatory protein